MNEVNKIDDAQWMAYVDGGLDAAGRAAVETAMAADPQLAARVQAQQQLRGRLQRGLAGELDEPVPDRLAALLAPAAAPVPHTAGATATLPSPAPNRAWWMAAAGLLIGLLLPRLLPEQGGVDLRIDGRLAQALETRLVADASGAEGWQPRLSFRDREGRYCRGFSDAEQAGLACKGSDGRWALQMLMPTQAPAGELRTASSALPPALLEAVDARAAGATLDAEAEAKAKAAGWR